MKKNREFQNKKIANEIKYSPNWFNIRMEMIEESVNLKVDKQKFSNLNIRDKMTLTRKERKET